MQIKYLYNSYNLALTVSTEAAQEVKNMNDVLVKFEGVVSDGQDADMLKEIAKRSLIILENDTYFMRGLMMASRSILPRTFMTAVKADQDRVEVLRERLYSRAKEVNNNGG